MILLVLAENQKGLVVNMAERKPIFKTDPSSRGSLAFDYKLSEKIF